jgi:ABC-type Mn2+/Zn2+ transport system permease subunit
VLDAVLLFREALYGTLVIALTCGLLGVYVVLRRIVFVGAALAELSSMGVALGLWLTGLGWAAGIGTHPLLLSVVATTAGVLFFALGGTRARIPPDAVIGVVYAAAGALGILLIAKAVAGEAHDVFLSGNVLGITTADTLTLLAVCLPVLLLHGLFYKEFLFVSFDPETALTQGYRVPAWNLLLYFTIGIVIAFAMQLAGVMLVFNFLVLPAVTGLLLSHGMRGAFAWAVASAVAASTVGFMLSVTFDLPTSPAIIAASAALTLLAWLGQRLRPAPQR